MQQSATVMLEHLQRKENTTQQAREVSNLLNLESPATHGLTVTMQVQGAQATELGPELSEIMRQVVTLLSAGEEVVVNSKTKELTTTVAAKALGMSRPTLMKHIHQGHLPAHKVGTHFRLKSEDVDAFHNRQVQERLDALNRLRDRETDLGL